MSRSIYPSDTSRDAAWHLQRQIRAREADLVALREARDRAVRASIEHEGATRRELAELLELSYEAIRKIEASS